jgi:hypothetical protein
MGEDDRALARVNQGWRRGFVARMGRCASQLVWSVVRVGLRAGGA